MITEANLGWLAGIADGEGSFNLSSSTDRLGCWVAKYAFVIGNTSLALILEAKRIMELIVLHEVSCRDGQGQARSSKNLRSAQVYLSSLDDLRVFCEVIKPYLVAKKRQAETMLEFCATGRGYRNGVMQFDGNRKLKRIELIDRMKWLNQHPLGNEEIASMFPARDLKASSSAREDEVKVRSALRDAESPRNEETYQHELAVSC